jgi:methionine synthase I (cobalamin-dependent)/5,10-methylenetetrahydrofolate reductase
MADRLADLLRRGPVLFDGAMGTELTARGADSGRCLEELNLSDPALVRSIHRDYIAAGADVIETNTFGGNRFRLGEHYLEMNLAEINQAGARLAVEARNASGKAVLVAGSIGPLGRPLEPIGAVKQASAQRIYREQVEALAAGGVDLLVFETFTAMHELELAVAVARAAAPQLPVIASLSFDEDAHGSDAASTLVSGLRPLGAIAVGVNCGSGPQAALEVARRLVEAGAPNVLVMPNAGLPERVGGRLVYTSGPEYFAAYTRQFLEAGVRLVGGCCGTGPAHIAAMRRALDQFKTVGGTSAMGRPRRRLSGAEEPVTQSGLAARLARGEFAISVELTPPRGIDPRRMLEGARLLKEAGVDFANITDSALARLRMGVLSCAALVQQQVGLETIAHFTTRDRNVMAIQSELIGAHALGIRNVLCLRGDPPRVGDYPNATAVWDVNAVGLITIIANMNKGLDANGTPIGHRAQFYIGAALNPNAENREREIRQLHKKLEAGANFLVTQPIYDVEAFRAFLEDCGPVGVPILVGVLPLVSARHAEFLHNEVPGVVIPETVRARISGAGEHAAEAGVELAVELLDAARVSVQGAYVIPAFGRYDLAAQVVTRVRELVG